MKKFDKDDLKRNIKENLIPKNKKKKDSRDELNVTNGQNGLHQHSTSNNSLDRLSPYSRSPMNRSPMGPSPSVSMHQTFSNKHNEPYKGKSTMRHLLKKDSDQPGH